MQRATATPPIVLVLLQHSANPDLQRNNGLTGLMEAADSGHEACVKALLRAKANTELLAEDGRTALQRAEITGHTSIAELLRQHAAPPHPAAPPDTGEPAEGAPVSLPLEVQESAMRGELPKVVKWLRKGGLVDAFFSFSARDGQPSAVAMLLPAAAGGGQPLTVTLLHTAVTFGHLEMVKELLKRGASIDLPTSLGYAALTRDGTVDGDSDSDCVKYRD